MKQRKYLNKMQQIQAEKLKRTHIEKKLTKKTVKRNQKSNRFNNLSKKGHVTNCHSPTQPQHELVLDLIMGRNPPTPPPHTGTFKALPGNLGS